VTADIAHFIPAHNYLNSLIKCGRYLYVVNLCSAMITQPIAYLTGYSDAGLSLAAVTAANTSRTLVGTITFLLYTASVQKHLLFFAQQVALAIFLPLGIVLRTFPLTRGAGNLFIALSIGAYFIFPLSYSMVMILAAPAAQLEQKCGISDPKALAVLDAPTVGCAGALGTSAAFSALPLLYDMQITGLKDILKFTSFQKLLIGSASLGPASLGFFEHIKPILVETIIYGMIYPFVIMAMTLTFVKTFATFLGADAQDMVQGLFSII
jgi:hypothetical protein